jgi:hypothetical protein
MKVYIQRVTDFYRKGVKLEVKEYDSWNKVMEDLFSRYDSWIIERWSNKNYPYVDADYKAILYDGYVE